MIGPAENLYDGREDILLLKGVHKSYGGRVLANRDISLRMGPGETRALIGPNGAGKTTLLNLIAGNLRPDRGEIYFHGTPIHPLPPDRVARLGVGRTYQRDNLLDEFTVFENVRLARQRSHLGSRSLWSWWSRAEDREEINAAAREMLATLGLAQRAGARAGELSHGEKRQLELAMALAAGPRLLLLDEPMAGLSPQEGRKITGILESLKGSHAILLVEHDMDAVFTLADSISVLVEGALEITGAPEEIRNHPAVRRAYLGEE
ncbi:MAG: ABC transporter ATP-binding protein [Deltaproteobacteria bacterium]|nr:ABC transporter ATP-binding protein [Deltaproteobacteria bacterium]